MTVGELVWSLLLFLLLLIQCAHTKKRHTVYLYIGIYYAYNIIHIYAACVYAEKRKKERIKNMFFFPPRRDSPCVPERIRRRQSSTDRDGSVVWRGGGRTTAATTTMARPVTVDTGRSSGPSDTLCLWPFHPLTHSLFLFLSHIVSKFFIRARDCVFYYYYFLSSGPSDYYYNILL